MVCRSGRYPDATQRCEQSLELSVADIQMEHKTDGLSAHAECANLLILQLLQEELGRKLLVQLDNHDSILDGQYGVDVLMVAQLDLQPSCYEIILPQALIV